MSKTETLHKNGQLCYITRFMTPNSLEMANGDFFALKLPGAAAFVFCLKFVDLSLSKLFCTMGRLAASFLLVSGVLRAEGGSKMSESSLL